MKAAPHVVFINPIRNMTVPVTVEIHRAELAFDVNAWDHIAECSLDLPSGKLQVHERTGGSVARFAVTPSTYQVRAFYGKQGSLDESALGGRGSLHGGAVAFTAFRVVVLKEWMA